MEAENRKDAELVSNIYSMPSTQNAYVSAAEKKALIAAATDTSAVDVGAPKE